MSKIGSDQQKQNKEEKKKKKHTHAGQNRKGR